MPGSPPRERRLAPPNPGDSGEYRLRRNRSPRTGERASKRLPGLGPAEPSPSPESYAVASDSHSTGVEPDAAELRDRAILARARSGDRPALAELLAHYQERIYCICAQMCGDAELARDLTQDSLVKIILGLSRFEGRSKLSTWIIRVAMNVCLTDRRRRKLRKMASIDGPLVAEPRGSSAGTAGPGSSGAGRGAGAGPQSGAGIDRSLQDQREPMPPQRAEVVEQRRVLYLALGRIEERQRAILILRDVHSLDYRQIAEVMDVADGTVKSRLFRARQALRQEIEAIEADRSRGA